MPDDRQLPIFGLLVNSNSESNVMTVALPHTVLWPLTTLPEAAGRGVAEK